MKGREKPFEILSSKEKEAFELASEILQWSSSPEMIRWQGVSKLREEATKVYELVSGMDMESDDRYYKVYEAVDALRKRYERLKEWIEYMVREQKFARLTFDPQKDTPEQIIGQIRSYLQRGMASIQFEHYHASPEEQPAYGDYVQLEIFDHSKRKYQHPDLPNTGFRLRISEVFAYTRYESPYFVALKKILEERYQKKLEEAGSIAGRLHDFGGYECDITLDYDTLEKLEEDFKLIFSTIKENPRMPKQK